MQNPKTLFFYSCPFFLLRKWLKRGGQSFVDSRSLGFNAAKNGEPCDPQGLRLKGLSQTYFFSLSHLHTRAENNHIRLQKAASQSLPWQFRRSTFDSLWSNKMFLDGERLMVVYRKP